MGRGVHSWRRPRTNSTGYSVNVSAESRRAPKQIVQMSLTRLVRGTTEQKLFVQHLRGDKRGRMLLKETRTGICHAFNGEIVARATSVSYGHFPQVLASMACRVAEPAFELDLFEVTDTVVRQLRGSPSRLFGNPLRCVCAATNWEGQSIQQGLLHGGTLLEGTDACKQQTCVLLKKQSSAAKIHPSCDISGNWGSEETASESCP